MMAADPPSKRLIEVAILIGTLGTAVYILGWALWLW
jgi:hypothetical protein